MAPLNQTRPASHYAVLDLPQNPAALRKADIKAAYHRALLKHHPDKSGAPKSNATLCHHCPTPGISATNAVQTYTIDEITTAYKVLSNPATRAEYDQSLRLCGQLTGTSAFGAGGKEEEDIPFRTGLEVFDLDDMEVELHKQVTTWYQSCRCGDEKGFLVQEDDLEREIDRGEIVVGCRGCSLWAKVVFAVDDNQSPEDSKS